MLKRIRVDATGATLDGERFSNTRIDDLNVGKSDYISFRVGVKENARNIGGVNLFGESFGDYPQNIVMRIDYIG